MMYLQFFFIKDQYRMKAAVCILVFVVLYPSKYIKIVLDLYFVSMVNSVLMVLDWFKLRTLHRLYIVQWICKTFLIFRVFIKSLKILMHLPNKLTRSIAKLEYFKKIIWRHTWTKRYTIISKTSLQGNITNSIVRGSYNRINNTCRIGI